MKALILSITAGQGHHQCAMAISEYLINKGVDCEIVDAFKYINPILYESVNHGYLLSTQNIPGAYGKVYRMAERRNALNMKITPAKITTKALSLKLRKLIYEMNPDVIICTHVFSAQLITALNIYDATTIGIVTDFTFHPYWEETSMDYYVTASEQLNNQAKKKFISEYEILPYGIPIKEKFAKKTEKSEARKLLGIEDKHTVFVMSGSMGYGHMLKQIKMLDKLEIDFQIVSVCGRNDRLKNSIDKFDSQKKIYNFGYVDNVDLIMDASDIIITKPGGLTTSEALAKKIPLILTDPIPGHEDRNVEFLLNNGAAMKATSTFPVDECIYELLTSKWRLKHMTEAAAKLSKPNATKDLGDFIIENCDTEIH